VRANTNPLPGDSGGGFYRRVDVEARRYLEQAGRVWVWLDGAWIIATREETQLARDALKGR
jgi:hypothetical protein